MGSYFYWRVIDIKIEEVNLDDLKKVYGNNSRTNDKAIKYVANLNSLKT